MDSYDILVIILSVALSISTIIWIFVGALLIQVFKKLKEVSDSAQKAVDNVEEFTEQMKKAGKATAFGSAFKQVKNAFKGKEKEDE